MKQFFIGPVTDRRKFMRHKTYSAYLREQQERVKIKTDAVQSKFYQIRYVAGTRCNQARRLYDAARQAIAAVEANDLRCPYEFSYEEAAQTTGRRAVRQRVELTLWDSNSLREHAVALGYATLLNSQSNAVIVAFSYFQNVIEEAGELQMSEDYWRYLQLRIDKMEQQWLEQNQETGGARFNKRRIAPMSGRI